MLDNLFLLYGKLYSVATVQKLLFNSLATEPKTTVGPGFFFLLIFKSLPHHTKASITKTNITQMVHVAYEIKGNWISNKTIFKRNIYFHFLTYFQWIIKYANICKAVKILKKINFKPVQIKQILSKFIAITQLS